MALGMVVLLVLLLLAGMGLPSVGHVERSVVVNAEPAGVFALTATLKRWPGWTAWTTNRFPDLTFRFSGPDTGRGAVLIAAGKTSGDGTVTITDADPASGLTYTLDFNHGEQIFMGAIRHTNTPDGLRVTWTLDANLGVNPLKRWAGMAMGTLMGGDMEDGLAKLKTQVEERR